MSESVGIVIVNWNTGGWLRRCLRSVEWADREALTVDHVVVVDNASRDGSADALERELRSVPLTVLRNADNRGFAAACNQGAARCPGDHLLFLNPDTELRADTLRRVGEFLRTGRAARVGVVGVRMVTPDGRPAISCSRFPTLRGCTGRMTGLDRLLPGVFPPHHLTPAETRHSRPVDQVIGAFFLVRRPLFEELGGFDERYFLYLEEVDFALRARHRGWLSYHLADAVAVHAGNVSSDQVRAARLTHLLCSRRTYSRTHWPRREALALLVLSLTLEPAARLLRAAAHRSPGEIAETVAGYGGYVRRLLTSRQEPAPPRLSPARRVLDVVCGTAALLVLAPLLLLLGVLVRAGSGGPALFRQPRVGAGGREFTLYKFRSMRRDATGPEVTCARDRRVTPLGRLLRRTSLDELPQLLNLVRGDMTLVGPRPETPGLARRYPPECRWVLAHRPGLTGPVQLRSAELAAPPGDLPDPEEYYLRVLVPRRVALDAEFLARPSLARVLGIVLRTAGHLVAPARKTYPNSCPGRVPSGPPSADLAPRL